MTPSDGATDVPLDVQPRAWIENQHTGSCSEGFARATLSLWKDGAELPGETLETFGNTNVIELDPTAPLEPNTTYTLRLTADESSEVVETVFTTGTSTSSAGDPTAKPSIVIVELREVDRDDDGALNLYWLDYEITPGVPDPAGLSLVRVEHAEEVKGVFRFGEAQAIAGQTSIFAGESDEICLTPVQESGNGTVLLGDEACVTPSRDIEDEAGGCSCGAGRRSRTIDGWFALALGLGGLLLRTRGGRDRAC